MADQGIWFKLHCSALDDPDLDNLPVADFGRWAKLGAAVKRHGNSGHLRLSPPARALCALFQVDTFSDLMDAVSRLPHVHIEEMQKPTVSHETVVVVSFENWLKYQGDFSSPRVRKFREMKRSKRRGEERRSRGEEKKNTPPPISPPSTHPYRRILDHHTALYRERFGKDLVVAWARDSARLKPVVETHGVEGTVELVEAFFTSEDRWIGESDYGVGAFLASVNKLVTARARGPKRSLAEKLAEEAMRERQERKGAKG